MGQGNLWSDLDEVSATQMLLRDMHDDLPERVGRLLQLADLSKTLGRQGTLLYGGYAALALWQEIRSSFVHGNFAATVALGQALAEQTLGALLHVAYPDEERSPRISFKQSVELSKAREIVDEELALALLALPSIRNPMMHFRSIDDPNSLAARSIETLTPAEVHLQADALMTLTVAIRLLSLAEFRVGQ